MFWRRKTSDGSSSGSSGKRQKQQQVDHRRDDDDDIAKLQRQFGIKPVSDADVHAEFSSLFRATAGNGAGAGASGLSPRSELLLFGGGDADDDDDEARILRALNISGTNIDQIDVDALDLSDDETAGTAKHELRHVLRNAHTTAAQNKGKNDPMQIAAREPAGAGAARSPDATARVRELKLAALAHKREGNVKEALALFREAKELEAQAGASPAVRASSPAFAAPAPVSAVHRVVDAAVADSDDDADTVDVTDDDMQNPEFLAQLTAMGLVSEAPLRVTPPRATVASLEARIQDAKQQAVQHKRRNEVDQALQWLRTAKDLEAQLAELRTSSAAAPDSSAVVELCASATAVTTATAVRATSAGAAQISTVQVVHAYTSAATTGDDDDDAGALSNVDVTDNDMNDPVFATELSKLGFDTSSDELSAVSGGDRVRERALTRTLQSALSIDDEDLIDAFDEADSDDENGSAGAGARPAAVPIGYGMLSADVPLVVSPPAAPSRTAQTPVASSHDVLDLQTQLQLAKEAALHHKRDGHIQDALESMRRVKQIEALLAHKNKQIAVVIAATPPVPAPVHDPVAQAQFHTLEQLLVDFGNRALALAKENLSIDRARATEWLNKRKEYATALDELREKRKDPLQAPPRFRIEQLSRQVEVELTDVAADQVVVKIHAVHELRSAAGRDVVVRFCLNFPATTPHEGKTSTVRVSAAPPYSTGSFAAPSEFRFPVQRSRGTQRLMEIKKAHFEVWTAGTFLRSPELIARGYQELTPFLSTCQVHCRVPFVGSNRKPTGGAVEVSIRFRTPLREKEMQTEILEELCVEAYPAPTLPTTAAAALTAPTTSSVPSRVSVTAGAVAVTAAPSSGTQTSQVNAVVSNGAIDDDADDDPHHPDLIVSYDVINEELAKIETKLPALPPTSALATELRDRLDSLALKKQLLEIAMESGSLTLEMYVAQLHARIAADRQLMAKLMRANRRQDAARVLHRVKLMEKELVGADDGAVA